MLSNITMQLPFSKLSSMHIRFMIAAFSNAILAIAQMIYAHQAHSVSLLSDALHNLGDVLGLFIAWGAQILATSTTYPRRYTYGYKQFTVLAAFINALLLLFSVGIIMYETLFKLTHSEAMDEIPVIFIASLGIAVNGLTALFFIKEKNNDINIKAAFLHLMLDALTSLGVVISALIVYYGGYQWIDSIIALAIGGLILVSGWNLLRHSIDLILGAIPEHVNLEEVTQYLLNIPGVNAVNHLHIWSIGKEESALTAHLAMRDINDLAIPYQTIQTDLAQTFHIQQATLQTNTPTEGSISAPYYLNNTHTTSDSHTLIEE